LLGALAYQVRLPAWVDIGALGDRAYLWASPLQADIGFNGDEHLADEHGVDYRWTKRVSWVRFPDVAWNGPLRVMVRIRGWRPEHQTAPLVTVRVNGALAGQFRASGQWETPSFDLDEFPGHTTDLEISLECPPFNPGGDDKRILGVQWDWVRVDPRPGGAFPVLPPWQQLLPWTGAVVLLYLALRRWLKGYAFWVGIGLAVLVALGLTFLRNGLTPYNLWALAVAGAVLLLAHADLGLRLLRQAGRRAHHLPFYATLIGVSVVLLVRYARWATGMMGTGSSRPDAVLGAVFIITLLLYALLTWDQRLRRLFAGLDRLLRGPWLSGVLLALLLAGVTLYEFGFIRTMEFVGHADYADNAVVARNLLAGRGFTVDYVTQFFDPNLPLSHPQETWPLLQPVLIAPFFQVLGDSAFAAKIPNLLLQLALALVLYAVGTNLFDRRVGLLAVLLTVLNPFIFRLIIFPTSDLAFTLLAMLLLAQFFRAHTLEEAGPLRWGPYAWAGVWAGLLMLAKVNGVFFVGVCFLVDLAWRWRGRRWQGFWRAWVAFGVPAVALFAPWIVRNLVLFRTPIHSTEQFDAWILKYKDWEDIYRVYYTDLPNRSWLLRYGWDRVFQAVSVEFQRWRNYFTVDQTALLTLLGSTLALGGALTLRRKAAQLFAPVGLALALFGVFICTYWHVEERYFVPFVPWLALLIARGLWWLYDALAYRRDSERRLVPSGFGWLGWVLVVLVCIQLIAPFPHEAADKIQTDQAKRLDLRAYGWLADNTPPDAVVMTRVPWQLTYYSDRRSVMIPQGGMEAFNQIVAKYEVTYLLMDGDARGKRPELRQALLVQGQWTLLYDEGGVQIYRLGARVEARRH
jgi:hypothetical protein